MLNVILILCLIIAALGFGLQRIYRKQKLLELQLNVDKEDVVLKEIKKETNTSVEAYLRKKESYEKNYKQYLERLNSIRNNTKK